jgi:hypothetical protein
MLGLTLMLLLLFGAPLGAQRTVRTPLRKVVDLNMGDSREVELCNGKKVALKLLDLREERDDLRQAVRAGRVKVTIDGRVAELTLGNYYLPLTVAGVQIDCPITKGYYEKTNSDRWGLGGKDARLRLWCQRLGGRGPAPTRYQNKEKGIGS